MRKHRVDIARPFRMWLYPIPGVVALVGWAYIFATSGWKYIVFGLLTLAAGALVYAVVWGGELWPRTRFPAGPAG